MNIAYDTGGPAGRRTRYRNVWADHRAGLELGVTPITTALVVAQVSRSTQ